MTGETRDLPDPGLPDQWCVHPDCGRPLIAASVWAGLTEQRREQLRNLGRRRHEGRGLCPSCHSAARANGTLIDHERRTMTRHEVAAELEHCTSPRAPRTRRAAVVAAQVRGITHGAVMRSLQRADRAARRQAASTCKTTSAALSRGHTKVASDCHTPTS